MPRAIAQFRHDVSFANLNPSLRVTIISPGGATIIIDAINGLPALGARACTISSAKSRQPPPHNLALFHELRCKAVHDARRVGVPRAIAQFRHDVSFANLNPSLRVTIISPGGATIIIDAINGLPALGARACTISSAKSRQPPPHNLALFHELRC